MSTADSNSNVPDYGPALAVATRAAREAGAHLLEDFSRPDGPRGAGDKAPADDEAEALIRDILGDRFPGHGVTGEELGARDKQPEPGETHHWWIDPNDGTRSFLKGFRGAAVSIGLCRGGEPVLGVVFAYAAPDHDGDLITWAEGQPMMRNGRPVQRAPWPEAVGPSVVAAVSQSADRLPKANAELMHPVRHRASPSIAYRLALVAAGEADVAASLAGPTRWDCAAGHALLRAFGGELYDLEGQVLRYDRPWSTDVIGGAPAICSALGQRPWRAKIFGAAQARADSTPSPEKGKGAGPSGAVQDDATEGLDLLWPDPGKLVHDSARLSRAQGAMLGQLAGDALGQLVEFKDSEEIAGLYPDGVRELHDGGTFNTLAGQPTDDSEMALALARTLCRDGRYHAGRALVAYAAWLDSGPYDLGHTTRRALAPPAARIRSGERDLAALLAAAASNASQQSQANGALMRVSPLGIFAAGLLRDRVDSSTIDSRQARLRAVAQLAREDARLTHPHAACVDANAVFATCIAYAIDTGAEAGDVYRFAVGLAREWEVHEVVHGALGEANDGPPTEFMEHMGWVRIAFGNAFAQLLHAPTLEAGIVDTVGRGGDTDTNAAIAGALLGAVHGRDALPLGWRRALSCCRPVADLCGVQHPRPRTYWPVDALRLAERLLWAGQHAPAQPED